MYAEWFDKLNNELTEEIHKALNKAPLETNPGR